MFKQRIWTALILIPVVLIIIWFLPMPWFAVLIAALVAWAAWEWSLFVGITDVKKRALYLIFVMALLVISYFLSIEWILCVAALAWIWAGAAVVCYQQNKKPLGFQLPWVVAVMGVLALVPCWLAINVLREDVGGPSWLLFAFVLIWAMDSGAYFAGKLWGKRKLIPNVSPNKTWEGLCGGVLLVLIVAFVVCLAFRVPFSRLLTICALSLVTALFALIGDLFESMLKRQVNIKDSGVGLPGHGGILDRLDSVIAAIPVFALSSMLFSRFL